MQIDLKQLNIEKTTFVLGELGEEARKNREILPMLMSIRFDFGNEALCNSVV